MEFRYGPTARALHWGTALAMLAQFVLGGWITWFEPADEAFKFRLYDIHENIGFTLLPLTVWRLFHRIGHPPAPLPEDLPAIMRLAAHANHAALYLALIFMPLIGLCATTAWGFPFKYLGLIPIPMPFGKYEALAETFSQLHFWGAVALGLAILAHAGGALYHAVVRKDGVMRRML